MLISYILLFGTFITTIAQDQVNVSDLTIEYSTFFGSTDEDDGYSMAFDSGNNMYLTGSTRSANFNTTSNAHMSTSPSPGTGSAFITKFSPSGEILYSSFLGGSATDTATEIAVDSDNNIVIVGVTRSDDFPISSNALDNSYGGGDNVAPQFCCGDGFITKFSSNWTLIYSSYIGGMGSEADLALQIDGQDNIYVSGSTTSPDFPTTPNAFQTSNNGGNDLFVTKFAPNGSAMLYSTLLGGSDDEIMKGGGVNGKHLAIDNNYNTYITAGSKSNDYPTSVNGYDTSFGGVIDVVVTKLSNDGSSLLYSTYLGGENLDAGFALDIDDLNNVYVIGNTMGNYPTTSSAPQSSFSGGGCGEFVYLCGDGFISSLSESGELLHSSYLGGSLTDIPVAIKINNNRDIGIVGLTDSTDFPLKNANEDDLALGDRYDMFVTTYSTLNFDIVHCMRIGGTGGSGWEIANGINTNQLGEWYFTGFSTAMNFPVTDDAYDSSHNGDKDVVIVKLGLEFPQPLETSTTSSSSTSSTSTTPPATNSSSTSSSNTGDSRINPYGPIFGLIVLWTIRLYKNKYRD